LTARHREAGRGGAGEAVAGRPVLAAVLGLALSATAAAGACREDTVELRGDWGQARFRVEIADDAAERNRGLMYREEMAPGAGMLFVYPTPQPAVSFWMRNTLIPLDMLFFDESGRLVSLHENARPQDDTPIPGGSGIRFVLEVNGGIAGGLGVSEGTELRHPAIPAEAAAWPC